MKHIFIIILALCMGLTASAQSPSGISYQVVVRDTGNAVVKNGPVGVSLSILQGSATGQAVYVETHQDSTNINGLVSLVLGRGTVTSGSFESIDWTSGAFYLKTEIDPTGGTSYGSPTVTRFASAPTAYFAETADTALVGRHADTIAVSVSEEGDTLYVGTKGAFVVIPGLSEANPSGSCLFELGDTTVVSTVTSDSTGKVWMDRNMGASQVATASDDELSYGDLYQWGRATEGHQCRESETTPMIATTATVSDTNSWHGKFIAVTVSVSFDWLIPGDDNLWQGVNGTNNPCPAGFRIPTIAEWEAEQNSWDNKNSNGAFASPLKLPDAGYRDLSSGTLVDEGSEGRYWSSSVSGPYVRYLIFNSGVVSVTSSDYRHTGASVRCIKD